MSPGLSWPPVVASLLVACGLAAPATAQVRLSLAGGFTPDPMEITITASGDTAADTAVRGCGGFVAESPALVVDYASPGVPLRLGAASDAGELAGVVVVAPDGIARCANVDGAGSASVRVEPAQAGEHAIFPALAAAGGAVAVRVFATEYDTASSFRPVSGLATSAPPAAGTHPLSADETGEISLALAPTTDARDLESGCTGWIDPSRPDAVIVLDQGQDRLEIRASSEADATLVVVGPDGAVSCNDDTHGLDPAVTLQRAAAGSYAVWVGTYSDVGSADATLRFTTSADAYSLRTEAEPAWGRHPLASDGRVALAIDLRGTSRAEDYDMNCWGQIDSSRPDAVFTLDAEQGQLQLRATSDTDTTLVVVGPDGRFHCNDDSNGLDPAVTIRPGATGDYAVWVGTYGGGRASAELTATAGERPVAAAPGETLVFTGTPLETLLNLFPNAAAADFGPDCVGQVNGDGPDVVIRLDAERSRLVFEASSEEDTTLVILSPDGSAHCDDDSYGLDPEVVLSAVPAGDYAVWIGTYGGGEATATLRVSGEGGGGFSPGGLSPISVSPFLGRPVSSAVEAFAILMNEQGLSEAVSYQAIEPQGPEGFTLTGVVFTDPTGEAEPLRVERLRIGDLDLEGLTQTGAPGRFSLSIEGINYDDLVTAMAEEDIIPPLPPVEGAPSLDISASMLPPEGDPTRRVVLADISLDGAFALGMEARMRWHEGVGVPEDVAELPTESMALELRNYGYIGDMLRAQAAEAGMEPAAMTRLILDSLGVLLAPISPGSPKAQAMAALTDAVADLDRAGVLRVTFSTESPQGLDALMQDFEGGAFLENPALDIGVTFTPLD